MADGNDSLRPLPQIAELIEILLRFLPEKHLRVAAQVCRLWRYIAQRLRASRRYSVACFVENQHASFQTSQPSDSEFIIQPALRFIDELYIEPSAVILIANFHPMQNFCSPKKMLQKLYKNNLPNRCVLAGCSGRLVIGSTFSNTDNDCLLTWEVERRKCLSLLFVPRAADVCVRSFYIPLKNKYKKIQGVRAFLPEVCHVKLVVVFAHPLSLGKLAHLTVAVRDKYGDGVTIVGGYSDIFLFHHKEVTSNEILGLVFGGNLQATSVVVEHKHSTNAGRLESLNQAMTRLRNSGISQDNSFGLMFTCSTKGNEIDVSRNKECIQGFGAIFPNTPLTGFGGAAAFGCDMENLKSQERKAGGRDFLQTSATVLCVCSIGTCPRPQAPQFFEDCVGQK